MTYANKLTRQVLNCSLALCALGVSAGSYGQSLNIMPIGDSITEGVRGECSYRKPLAEALLNRSQCPVAFVGARTAVSNTDECLASNMPHEAISGIRADFFNDASRMEVIVDNAQPDIVIAHLGSNDLNQRQGVASTIEDIDGMVDLLFAQKPGVTVLLANIIPWDSDDHPNYTKSNFPNDDVDMMAETAELAEEVDALVTARRLLGQKIRLVDVRSGFDTTTMTVDGVHPNADGDAHIADRVLAVLDDMSVCPPYIESPMPGTPLTSITENFRWTDNNVDVTEWWVYAGSAPGARDYFNSGHLGTDDDVRVTDLPGDGSTVYITLWYKVNGKWNRLIESY